MQAVMLPRPRLKWVETHPLVLLALPAFTAATPTAGDATRGVRAAAENRTGGARLHPGSNHDDRGLPRWVLCRGLEGTGARPVLGAPAGAWPCLPGATRRVARPNPGRSSGPGPAQVSMARVYNYGVSQRRTAAVAGQPSPA